MKKIRKWYSFTGLCVVLLLLYTMSFLLYRSLFEYMEAERMHNAFPDIQKLLEQEEILKTDAFENLSMSQYPKCSLIVFDVENQRSLFASDEQIAQNIYYEDLEFINDYSTGTYFNVYRFQDDKKESYYSINRVKYDDAQEIQTVEERCIINGQYEVVEGNLFKDRRVLGKRALDLLLGIYGKKMNIEKYAYANEDGESRVLVFVSPRMTDVSYDRMIVDSGKRQLYAFPIFLMIVFIQIVLFKMIVKRSFLPFQKAIVRYRENANTEFDETTIPLELRQTAREFQYTTMALEQAKQEKQKADQEKYAMISGISHDLKTPLTVIRGFSEALMEGRIPEEKRSRYLQTIYTRSLMANTLVDSLFEYVKIEHPSYRPQLIRTDICEYTKQFLAEKYQEIADQGFTLDVDIPDQPLYSLLDTTLFSRVLANIMDNTIKHNPPQTAMGVQIFQKDLQNVWILWDDGIGIEPSVRKSIFVPFVTGDESRHDAHSSGLGMAIAHKIVLLHGGQIEILSSGPHAVAFQITLPRV